MQVRVQNLPASYQWQDLKDIFNGHGAIRADIVSASDEEGYTKGIVRFTSAEAAEAAVQVIAICQLFAS